MKSRYNPVLVAVILVGLVCALWVNWNRHTIEQRNNTVEMAMEYENLRKLAALEGLPEEIVVKQFQDAGINSLMVFDTTRGKFILPQLLTSSPHPGIINSQQAATV